MSIKSHFLSALKRQNRLRPPVWLMRQAGRYLPEYRKLRSKHPFLALCQNRDLIVETTLLPFKEFSFDAAILFSDILLPLQALNIPLAFDEAKGPRIGINIDLFNLPPFDPYRFMDQFRFQAEAIALLKKELKVPLIGFAGAPFTLAAYLIEGGSSTSYEKTKLFALENPKLFSSLLELLANLCLHSLLLQIEAGVDAVQIFDTHLDQLSPDMVRRFALPPLKKILQSLTPSTPTILFAKGPHAPLLAEAGSTGLSVDWTTDLAALRASYPTLVLQGNLDPVCLLSSPSALTSEIRTLLDALPDDPAYIFNLGHGILPTTPLESVHTLLEAILSNTSIRL